MLMAPDHVASRSLCSSYRANNGDLILTRRFQKAYGELGIDLIQSKRLEEALIFLKITKIVSEVRIDVAQSEVQAV